MINIYDEDRNPCITANDQQGHWRRHFTSVLNIRSGYDDSEVHNIRHRCVDGSLGQVPTLQEVAGAVSKLKNVKAPGSSNILPEMLKVGCKDEEFINMIVDLLSSVWKERKVPKEWIDAILVPIPKKGDLKICDNWQGIALLEVVGKMTARIIQDRLQKVAERELSESQCRFRGGRGCTDMTFTVRQLVEKSTKHTTKLYIIFVDLRKAYDSVPCEALWVVLKRLGVPDTLIDIVKSFYEEMEAKIRLDQKLLEEIEVNNGSRQGFTLAPTLFNLYACAVQETWWNKINNIQGVGAHIL